MTHRAAAGTACLCAALTGSGCGEGAADLRTAAPEFMTDWFERAAAGVQGDEFCHGFGLLKHPEFTCDDMLDHARRIDPASRSLERVKLEDCVDGVCGEFAEIDFTARDATGTTVREHAIVKRDGGKLQLYWYRSDTMLDAYRAAHPEPSAEDEDPLQLAYDELVARYPALYAFPRCWDVTVSSSNLAGDLIALDAVDVAAVETVAQKCVTQSGEESFCFALVGSKIAPVCKESAQ